MLLTSLPTMMGLRSFVMPAVFGGFATWFNCLREGSWVAESTVLETQDPCYRFFEYCLSNLCLLPFSCSTNITYLLYRQERGKWKWGGGLQPIVAGQETATSFFILLIFMSVGAREVKGEAFCGDQEKLQTGGHLPISWFQQSLNHI